jgi:hypothetical protein
MVRYVRTPTKRTHDFVFSFVANMAVAADSLHQFPASLSLAAVPDRPPTCQDRGIDLMTAT